MLPPVSYAGLGILMAACAQPQSVAWAKVEKGIEDLSTAVSSAMALAR